MADTVCCAPYIMKTQICFHGNSDVTVMLKWRHRNVILLKYLSHHLVIRKLLWKYIYDVIGKGAWQTVSAMLRQCSLAIQTEILSTEA